MAEACRVLGSAGVYLATKRASESIPDWVVTPIHSAINSLQIICRRSSLFIDSTAFAIRRSAWLKKCRHKFV